MLFLDTCICIDFLRGSMPGALKMLQRTQPERIKISTIVEAELYLGARKSAREKDNRRKIDLFLAPFEKVAFDSTCAEIYAEVRADLESRGSLIGPNDLLIAATVLAHKATLVTNNTKEFNRIEGLLLESWEEVPLV